MIEPVCFLDFVIGYITSLMQKKDFIKRNKHFTSRIFIGWFGQQRLAEFGSFVTAVVG